MVKTSLRGSNLMKWSEGCRNLNEYLIFLSSQDSIKMNLRKTESSMGSVIFLMNSSR